jgi:hypothetical protein
MAKMLSTMKHLPAVPVTAISFICNDEMLLVGRGSWVSAYHVSSGEELFSKGVLCLDGGLTASIHGFAAESMFFYLIKL